MSTAKSITSSSISTTSVRAATVTEEESAENVIDSAVLQFFQNESSNAVMKCTIRRSENNPGKFSINLDIKNVNEKKKRHMILTNCFDHCDCLHQLVELRRQKRAANAFHNVSMNYGAEASFQRPNIDKHIKHVRSRKSVRSLAPSSSKSSRRSTKNSSK